MIVTVTMNPAIDKTVEIHQFLHKGLNRISKVEYDAGGKGINVSKTIKELGGESIATGFLAGNNGQVIANILKTKGITGDFVWVEGETRTNTKVIESDSSLTELNEPGPLLTEENLNSLKEKLLHYADEDCVFIFAGSIPSGVSKDIYGELIRLVKEKGAKVLLDADGEAFKRALPMGPAMIKPNHVELAEFAALKDPDIKELVQAAEEIRQTGIDNIVVSMGKDGALFLLGDYKAKCPGLSIKAHSAVGAGDAMVAAFAYALDKKLSPAETAKLCMASSAGACTTIGTKPPSRQVVDELLPEVQILQI